MYYAKQRFLYSLIISAIVMCVCAVFFPIGEGETPAEETQCYEKIEAAATEKYTLNTATKKAHLPNCEAAETISNNNNKYVIATKESLTESGFEKCFSCNPY